MERFNDILIHMFMNIAEFAGDASKLDEQQRITHKMIIAATEEFCGHNELAEFALRFADDAYEKYKNSYNVWMNGRWDEFYLRPKYKICNKIWCKNNLIGGGRKEIVKSQYFQKRYFLFQYEFGGWVDEWIKYIAYKR